MAKELKTTLLIGGKVAPSLKKAFGDTEKQTEGLEKAFKAASNVGVKAMKAVAIAAGTIAVGIYASAEATREYRKDLAKMYNNAEMAGVATSEAFSGLEDLYAMSGEFDSANEAMSNLLATGYKGEDLVKVIEAVNGATVKWQDTITQESLADAINETVMSGKSVGQFDEILARSGVNLDTFNDGLLNCRGLAERQQYVLSWLAKSGLTEVNAAYQEQNKSLVDAYKADLQYQNSMAKLGKVAEPIAALFKSTLSKWIGTFAEKLQGVNFDKVSSALQKVGELGSEAFELIWRVLSKIDWVSCIDAATTILEIFVRIFNFVVNNWSSIAPLIYGIVGALVAYKAIMVLGTAATTAHNIACIAMAAYKQIQNGVSLKAAAATAIETAAQTGLNLAFLACPITWIVLGVGLLIAAFVALWKKSEAFRNFFTNAWNMIKAVVGVAVAAVTAKFNQIKQTLQPIIDLVQKLIGKFKEVGEAIKTSKVGQAVSKAQNWVAGLSSKIAGNALGSTITSPTLTWVGEGGDVETIVPHNNKPRSRALALEAVKGTGLNIGGHSFVFAPNITSYGGGAGELQSLLEDEFNKFKMQMEEWASNQRRVAY